MNSAFLGSIIASLRKKKKLTQSALADLLNVSNKTVSKWETGLSYPELSLLPRLAAAFGVTVDYLLSGERNGIAVAGNLHWDTTLHLDADYRTKLLANVASVSEDVGGCAPCIALNLAKIDPAVPLLAIGCIGTDENGRRILARLNRYYIQTGGVVPVNAATGTNQLFIEPGGERFQIRSIGANALFDPTSIDVTNLNCRLMHFDRLYLPEYWEPDEAYGCKLARTLHDLQEAGIQTSISVVHTNFVPGKELSQAVLKYCDFIMLDARWLQALTGSLDPAEGIAAFRGRMEQVLRLGVREKVFLFPDYFFSYCLSKNGGFTTVRMPEIREEDVVSTKGFSDDSCSGCLYGIYQGYSDKEILEFSLATAALGCLRKKTADDMRPKKEIQQYITRAREKTKSI